MRIFYCICFLLTSSRAFAENAVTYPLNDGRFGDCLLSYIHAKWLSYKYDVPLLYVPFRYSHELKLSQLEPSCYTNGHRFTQKILQQHEKLETLNAAVSTLFMIPYFPESAWERENLSLWNNALYFHVDPSDPGFKTELKRCIAPIQVLPELPLPKNRTSVAVHVRLGTGVDTGPTFECFPMKFPAHEFYIDGIRTIYQMLHRSPLYVHIFTDDPNPLAIVQKYQSALSDCNIEFGFRESGNRHDSHVVEDFFAMTQFDCSVHGDSNYSICASFIADYKIEITPVKPYILNDRALIDVVRITTNKEMKNLPPFYKFGLPAESLEIVKRFLPSNPVVVEAGAFDGQETCQLAKTWPLGRIHAFEPVKELYNKVVNRTQSIKNVSTYPFALGDEAGKKTMYLSSEDYLSHVSQSSSLFPPKEHLRYYPASKFNTTEEVSVITLDQWAETHKIDKVDMLWLDMQGYELPALKACPRLLSTVSVILTEVEFVEAYQGQPLFEEVKSWLEGQGFVLIGANFDVSRKSGEWFGDALFIRKDRL